MQRQIRAGSAVEGGSAAGAAGARRRGRPWKGGSTAGAAGARRRGRPWQLQQLLVGLTHRLSPVSSDAARTLKRGSCAVTAVTGGEFSGRRLLFSSNPVSPLLSASGDVVPSTTVKHQIVIHYQGGQYSFQGLIRPRIFSWLCDLFCRYVSVRLAKASILFRFFLTTFLYIETHIYFQAQYWSPSSYNPKAGSGGQAEASSPPFEEKDDKDVQARVTRNKWCCLLCCPSIYASLQFVQT